VPKYKLLLGAAFGKVWEEHEVLKPLEELSEAEVACFQAYRRSVVEERSLDPLRVRGGGGVHTRAVWAACIAAHCTVLRKGNTHSLQW
jgi:hypothetical protein